MDISPQPNVRHGVPKLIEICKQKFGLCLKDIVVKVFGQKYISNEPLLWTYELGGRLQFFAMYLQQLGITQNPMIKRNGERAYIEQGGAFQRIANSTVETFIIGKMRDQSATLIKLNSVLGIGGEAIDAVFTSLSLVNSD